MRKISLSSVIAVMITCPVFAEPSHTSGTFPVEGHMLEDYTYTGAATYGNMGTYSGTVNATADYTDNTYNVVAGTYLPAASETVTQCPANSYCPGLTGPTYYNANAAQGATSCPSGYPNSVAGASASTECYTACTVANANIAHATAVSGNDYNGGTDTCAATGCEDGYHVKEGVDLAATIGNATSENTTHISEGDSSVSYPEYGISEPGAFAVRYDNNKGTLRGMSKCSSQVGTNNNNTWSDPTISATLPDSSGQYCYCRLDSYTPVNGDTQNLSGSWVFIKDLYDAEECMTYAGSCAWECSNYVKGSSYVTNNALFRAVIFGTVESGPATCEANTITINWSDASDADITANNAGQCTFGGDIRTPRAATVKPGKTFVGWKFVKPNNNGN